MAIKQNKFTIIVTHGDDFERIIEANFLNDADLSIVEQTMISLYKKFDADMDMLMSMSDKERNEFELNGFAKNICWTDNPFIVFDNNKHKDLICYIKLAGIGMELELSEIPDVFERYDAINLLETQL